MFLLKKRICVIVNCNYSANYSDICFVPKCEPVKENEINYLRGFFQHFHKILVLTGAGISTESGIPDYRSKEVGLYARSNHRPVQYQEFIKHQFVRKRYWARNFVGWPRFSQIQPNITHKFLSDMENDKKKIIAVVTQNVDSLHGKANSKNVIELHGTAHRVHCIKCKHMTPRHIFQEKLIELNPNMKETTTFLRPDGDVDLTDDQMINFKTADCEKCGGILKPDIVFFGDNVPRDRVERIQELVEQCDSILVLGSSLSVFSGYRILMQGDELGKYIAIVNIGETRGDKLADKKINAKCGEILSRIEY